MDFFKKASASFGGSEGQSDVLKQAEGFLGSSDSTPATTDAPVTSTEKPAADAPPAATASTGDAPASENYSELYGSAQTLYQGLQGKLGGKQTNVDDQELAAAANNVLQAAENAGFGKDSQYGEYFNKAESYLQNYGQPKATAAPTFAPTAEAPAAEAPAVEAPAAEAAPAAAPPAAAPPAPTAE